MMSKSVIARSLSFLFLAVLSLAAILPLIYTVTNSFVGSKEFFQYFGGLSEYGQGNPFHLIPNRVSLESYFTVFLQRPDYLIRFWVSLGICGLIVAGQVIVAVLGGYAFAKFRFPGRDALFFIIIVIMMAPPLVTLVPNYIMLDHFGWIGGYQALILPGIFSAFGVFLMRQFMLRVPDDFLEAARLDGAGPVRILFMVLSNCKSGLSALIVLNFIDSWNMVEQPLIFLQDTSMYPMSVFLTLIAKYEPALSFTCGLLAMLPALYLFMYFREDIAGGIGKSVIK